MTPEQEQEVLKLASECGAVPLGDQTSFDGKKWVDTVRLVFNQERLTSFASKLRTKDASEIESLKKQVADMDAITNLPIKWYVSEREARFVFASMDNRDEFVRFLIGAQPPEKHFTDFDKTLPVRAHPVESDLDQAMRYK
jgi:hypothetical protein